MSDIFDIDFNQQAVDLLPPDKRDEQPVSLLSSLLNALQWARDLVLGSIKTGAITPRYSPGTYTQFQQVVFNKAVYECIALTTTNDPTSSDWRLIQNNFIGVDERILYNGQKIVLEYALNKEFDGVFRQPATGMNSDIYLNNLPAVIHGFRIGQTEAGSSSIGQTTSSDSIGSIATFVQVNNFQINFLNSLYVLTNEKAIRGFVDKYIPESLNYTIVTY